MPYKDEKIQKEYHKQYYLKHRKKLLKNVKKRYRKNKEKILLYQKEYHQKNRKRRLKKMRKYIQKPEVKERRKKYYHKNIKKMRKQKTEWYHKNIEKNRLIHNKVNKKYLQTKKGKLARHKCRVKRRYPFVKGSHTLEEWEKKLQQSKGY